MKIPWQRFRNRPSWFWGSIGALCLVAVLLVLVLLPPATPASPPPDKPASSVAAPSAFRIAGSMQMVTISMQYPGFNNVVTIDHQLLQETGTEVDYTVYKAYVPSLMYANYVATTPPTGETAEKIHRILYQSIPYLSQEEVLTLLTQNGFDSPSAPDAYDIMTATQLAILSAIHGAEFTFSELPESRENVKPLYDYYMGIPADTPAAPLNVRIDTAHAMWSSGTTFGPMRILPNVNGFASGVVFDLEAARDNVAEYSFKNGMNEPITSIAVGEPFYLQIADNSNLLDIEHAININALSRSELTYGGDMLTIVVDPLMVPPTEPPIVDRSTAAETPADTAAATETSADVAAGTAADAATDAVVTSLSAPISNDMLFSAYSTHGAPVISAVIRITPSTLK